MHDDVMEYWPCACVKRSKVNCTHIKMNHRSVARCGRCKCDRPESVPWPPEVTPKQLELLKHTLGCNERNKRLWGYRNRFCAGIGSGDHKAFNEMVALKLAYVGSTINGGRDQYFHATVDGCFAAGMSKAMIMKMDED